MFEKYLNFLSRHMRTLLMHSVSVNNSKETVACRDINDLYEQLRNNFHKSKKNTQEVLCDASSHPEH